METSVISRHWPASADQVHLGGAAEPALRRAVRELEELRRRVVLGRMVDRKVGHAIDILREAEEAERWSSS